MSYTSTNKVILIPGGAGFIGSVLVPKLLALNYSVIVVDLLVFGNTLPLKHKRLQVIQGNVLNLELMNSLMKQVDIVIHLAFITDNSIHKALDEFYDETNFNAAINIAKIAREQGGKRFIFASSTSVYGEIPNGTIVNEQYSPKPIDKYGKAKLETEQGLLKLVENDFDVIIVRPSTVSGYSPRQRFDLLVNRMLNQAFHNKKIQIKGAQQVRPGVTIEDITNFYVSLLKENSSLVRGQIFNLSYENHTVKVIAENISKLFDEKIVLSEQNTSDRRSYTISSRKVSDTLGFRPVNGYRDAALELLTLLKKGHFNNPMDNLVYFNRIPM